MSAPRLWIVEMSLPRAEGRAWRPNKSLGVLTTSAGRALEIALRDNPGAEVWSVRADRNVTVTLDPEV